MHPISLESQKTQIEQWLAQFPAQAPVVAVPIFNAYADLMECIASLQAHTPVDCPLLLVDDASTDERIPADLTALATQLPQRFAYVRNPANQGFVGSANFIFAAAGRRDVVLVNSDIVLPPRWLPRLQAAAYARAQCATATPLTNHGSILSIPERNQPQGSLPNGWTCTEVDQRVEAASLKLRPVIPTAVGHCTYFRRSALDVVGDFDMAFYPGYGEEVDFSQRAISHSFVHLAADDLFVFHKGSQSFGAVKSPTRLPDFKAAHEEILRQRYPWYSAWVYDVANRRHHPLALALERASKALTGYSIALDLTYLAPTTTGTSVVALELARALQARIAQPYQLTLILRDAETAKQLVNWDGGVQICTAADFTALEQPCFDLVYRPSQLFNPDELLFLRQLAHRVVIMVLDFIAYGNPAYARSYAQWKMLQRLMQLSFTVADGITFNSQAVIDDAAMYGLVMPSERGVVVYNGVDHVLHCSAPTPPVALGNLPSRSFLLLLGTNFKHKNRIYGLRVLAALHKQYQWQGKLILCGPAVAMGGSEAEEASLRAQWPELAEQIVDIGVVSEAEKRWLLENAAVVLYPSVIEGFGLIPFEAAAANTPALSASSPALREVLGEDVLYLPAFDPSEGAAVIWQMIHDPVAAQRQLAAIQARQALFQWQGVAERVWQLCETVLALPVRVPELALADLLKADAGLHSPARNWAQRIGRAGRILYHEGWRGLVQEGRQYMAWKRQHG